MRYGHTIALWQRRLLKSTVNPSLDLFDRDLIASVEGQMTGNLGYTLIGGVLAPGGIVDGGAFRDD